MFKQLTSKPKRLENYSQKEVLKSVLNNDKFRLQQPHLTIIVGKTGTGKTNLLCNLIYDSMKWTQLYLNAKDLSEGKYVTLFEACQRAQFQNKHCPIETFYEFNNLPENIVSVDNLDAGERNLIIFDDFITDKSADKKINDLCIRGRKKNVSIIYLAQSYFDIPKIIRLQAGYLIFFKTHDNREVGNIYQNHNLGLNKKTFCNLYYEATREPYSFLLIDNVTNDEDLKIRKNFYYGFSKKNQK